MCYKIYYTVLSNICPIPYAILAAIVTTPIVKIINYCLSSAIDISLKELIVFLLLFIKLPKIFLMFVSYNNLSI